jgi:hypothetical protein
MPLDTPLTLGPFSVDHEGRLAPSTPDRFPAFRLRWRQQDVTARLASSEGDRGTLALATVLGRVPSTGPEQAPATAAREAAFATLRALPGTLPPGWRLALRPDHRITLEAQTELALPASAASLLTEVTLFLLRLGPYLDLLAEAPAFEAADLELAEPAGTVSAPRSP